MEKVSDSSQKFYYVRSTILGFKNHFVTSSIRKQRIFMRTFLIGLVALAVVSCAGSGNNVTPSKADVNMTLDGWHQAASDANFERYFGYFASDSAIFMGTDATERWTIAEFRPWAKPYFEDGQAWDFTPVERHIYFSENGQIAWFDESLDTPNLGPARGSGVLRKQQGQWKITHYNLSIPIPNAIVDTVVQQIDEELQDTTDE